MKHQRKHKRGIYDAEIKVEWEDEEHTGRSVDISRGGIFIQTDPLPPFGAKVTLYISLPGIMDTCAIPCTVRWTKEGRGAGLQFDQMRAIETWALNKLMHTLDEIED